MNAISVANGAIAKGGKRAQFLIVAGALAAAFLLYTSLTGSKTSTSTSKPLAAQTAAAAAATAAAAPAARTVTPPATYEISARDPFAFAPGADGQVAAGAATSVMGTRIAAAEHLLLAAQAALTPALAGRPTLELQDGDLAAVLPGIAVVATDASPKNAQEISYRGTTDRLVLATRAEGGDCFLVQFSKSAGQTPFGFARVAMTAGTTCRADATQAVTFAPDQLTGGWSAAG